ncbi:hypothetical protein M885DRAFT_618593 [Pelagophyceae sp. CCMP2097]|nr:hypothetical protein M885DRAFT_618593 [Pelagophyceae sp. CCMP2097]
MRHGGALGVLSSWVLCRHGAAALRAARPTRRGVGGDRAFTALRSASPGACCPVASTAAWVRHVVVHLALCPWAAETIAKERMSVVDATREDAMAAAVAAMDATAETPQSTTLVALRRDMDWETYWALAADVDSLLDSRGLRGVVQLATFHPRYRFDGGDVDAAEHWTNRSPFPLLHFLREDDVEAALRTVGIDGDGDSEPIWQKNVATCQRLGAIDLESRLQQCLVDSQGLPGADR